MTVHEHACLSEVLDLLELHGGFHTPRQIETDHDLDDLADHDLDDVADHDMDDVLVADHDLDDVSDHHLR